MIDQCMSIIYLLFRHGPGNDPYMVREVGTELDVKTSFRGEVNE
jgi:hypothetical protein